MSGAASLEATPQLRPRSKVARPPASHSGGPPSVKGGGDSRPSAGKRTPVPSYAEPENPACTAARRSSKRLPRWSKSSPR